MPKETFENLPHDKRNRIIEIAINEFAANPYDVASISNIVRKASIAKGSFYQYFEDKKDLYLFLITLSNDKKIQLLKEIPAPNPSSELFDYFRWQFLSAVFFEIRHPKLAKITYRAFVEEVPFPEMTEELRRRGTTQFFKQLLTQGIMHGEVGVWVDPDVAAFILEVTFYQFGKYFIERLHITENDFLDKTIFRNEEAQVLIGNLMDILEAGIKRAPVQRKVYA